MSSKLEKDAAWEGSVRGTLYKQLLVRPKPIPSTVRLAGQTAIITGANGGLGLEAARQLLKLGLSHLIMAVRSQEKGDAAALSLQNEFSGVKIDVLIIDLTDYGSITAFVERCRNLERVDYTILNAGIQSSGFKRNDTTGHELVFQTNYLSTVLLALLLVPVMKATPRHDKQPVLTIVGSDTMYFSKLDSSGPVFPRMDDPARFGNVRRYMDSKLMLMMFVARLAEQTKADDVVINVCNPGATAGTGLGKNVENPSFAARFIAPLVGKALGRSKQAGASVYVYALLMAGQESHGGFVSDWAIKPYPALMYTQKGRELMDRLWQETMEELRLIAPSN